MNNIYPTLSLKERDRRWGLVRQLTKKRGLDRLNVVGLRRSGGSSMVIITNEAYMKIVVFPSAGKPTYPSWNAMFIT